MSSIRSHLDLWLFCQFVTIDVDPQNLSLLDAVRNHDKARLDADTWRASSKLSPGLQFHETYHFWQALRYPFLYAFASYSIGTLLLIVEELANRSDDYLSWKESDPKLFILGLPRRVAFMSEEDLIFNPTDREVKTARRTVQLSALDLLEGSASVAEWMYLERLSGMTSPDADPIRFRRWCKRIPSYVEAFNVLSSLVGDELALKSFLPMCEAAFHTSVPPMAFVWLAGSAAGQLRYQGDHGQFLSLTSDEWRQMLLHVLGKAPFGGPPDSETVPIGGSFIRLSLHNALNASLGGPKADEKLYHPHLHAPACEWRDEARTTPDLNNVLSGIADVPLEVISYCLGRYRPEVTLSKFVCPDGEAMVVATALERTKKQLWDSVSDYLTAYSLARRTMGGLVDQSFRMCWHKECPLFAENPCSAYPNIPRHFESCGFPKRAADFIRLLREYKNGPPKV